MTIDNLLPTLFIDEAHCFDLESISSYDSEEVVAVKEHIKDFVRKLLK